MKTTHADYFGQIEDWRRDHLKLHKLSDIVLLCVSALLCGADTFTQIEIFGKAHASWYRKHGNFSNGIPSHDTIRRVLCVLNPVIFSKIMTSWVLDVAGSPRPEEPCSPGQKSVIAFDGKALRGAWDKGAKEGLMLVSAWATDLRLCLGVLRVEEKTNEITALKQLLGMIDLTGKIITTDAMGTQKEICELILAGQGDYVLALKENHPKMYAEAEAIFASIDAGNGFGAPIAQAESCDKAHGRVESRKCEITSCLGLFDTEQADQWPGLKTLVRTTRSRGFYRKGQWVEQTETAYHLSSIALQINDNQIVDSQLTQKQRDSAGIHLAVVRQHWGVENQQHYVLDVILGEDDCYVRKDHAPENLSICRRAAIGLASRNKPGKLSLKSTLYTAAFNDELREILLFGLNSDA